MLTDKEDGSARDCRYAEPGARCQDATDVYDVAATRWAGTANLNSRFYMYPGVCGSQDPTWGLDRHVDPRDSTRGFSGLKPGHPERILFAAIVGVPLFVPQELGPSDWDALLGTSPSGNADDFCARDDSLATTGALDTGLYSMRYANPDTACDAQRVVPARRRPGTTPGCTSAEQYFAWPSRRIVEIARRFDRDPLCQGSACHNGIVASVCGTDYTLVREELVRRIQRRLTRFMPPCVRNAMSTTPDASGNVTVPCVMRETEPEGVDRCSATEGRADPLFADGTTRGPAYTNTIPRRRICEVRQIAANPSTQQPTDANGWFYCADHVSMCSQRIGVTPVPEVDAVLRLECP